LSSHSATALLDALRRRGLDRVWTTGRTPRAAATDFGRIVNRPPAAVVETRDESEALAALDAARECATPVALRGAGHSVAGQSTNAGGMVLRHRPAPGRGVRLLDGDRVEVAAGCRWRDVERALARAGRSVPVLADYLDLTVGGTLSVGGYGVDSVRHGAQVHHVDGLRLILPEGGAVWCSHDQNPEWFRYSLAGLGQIGILDRVVLRTVPRRRFVGLSVREHRGLAELVDSLLWMAEDRDALDTTPAFFKALWSRGRFRSTYGVYADDLGSALAQPELPPACRRNLGRPLVVPAYRELRSAAVALWVARFPAHRRLWADFLLDARGLTAFAEQVETLERAGAFARFLRCVYIVAVRQPDDGSQSRFASRLPFEAASGLPGRLAFGVGLYAMVPTGDAAALALLRRTLRSCLDACVELGGRPYLYGWHELEPRTLARLYGDSIETLREIRRRVDPHGLLAAPLLGPAAGAGETAPAAVTARVAIESGGGRRTDTALGAR
jgi:FAD/FMN-containing dehydrogenase